MKYKQRSDLATGQEPRVLLVIVASFSKINQYLLLTFRSNILGVAQFPKNNQYCCLIFIQTMTNKKCLVFLPVIVAQSFSLLLICVRVVAYFFNFFEKNTRRLLNFSEILTRLKNVAYKRCFYLIMSVGSVISNKMQVHTHLITAPFVNEALA